MSRILLQYAIVSYTTLYTDAGFAVSSYYAIQQRKQCSLQLHRRTKNAAAPSRLSPVHSYGTGQTAAVYCVFNGYVHK